MLHIWSFSRSCLGKLLDVKITFFLGPRLPFVELSHLRVHSFQGTDVRARSYVEDMDRRSKIEGNSFTRYSQYRVNSAVSL